MYFCLLVTTAHSESEEGKNVSLQGKSNYYIALDKGRIQKIICLYCFVVCIKNYLVGTLHNCLTEVIPTNIHKTGFGAKLTKTILNYYHVHHFIWRYAPKYKDQKNYSTILYKPIVVIIIFTLSIQTDRPRNSKCTCCSLVIVELSNQFYGEPWIYDARKYFDIWNLSLTGALLILPELAPFSLTSDPKL